MPKASGTVYRYGSEKRIPYALIKAFKEGQVRYSRTDNDGDFSFGDLEPGRWTLVTLHESSFPGRTEQIDVLDDKTDIRIELFRLQGTEDERAGFGFFYALLAGLGVLLVAWLVLHVIVPGTRAPLSLTLGALITQAEQQIDEAEQPSQSQEVLATISDIGNELDNLLAETEDLSASDRERLENLFAEVEQAVAADRNAAAASRLARLRQLVVTPPAAGFALWAEEPLRFLEVFLWGLAGVLVNKIITTGWYLRSQRFYREGIVMHIANIVTAPFLVLVTVFLLSLVTFQLTVAGSNELTLDLSDPRLLVAVSFLLGSQPWSVWDFLKETAGRITGQQA